MRTQPPQPSRTRTLRVALVAAVAAACAACGGLPQAPKVDLVDTVNYHPPVPLATAPPPQINGSLYQAASYRPGFEDRRARLVGDALTIQIVENISASQKSSSTVDRTAKNEAGISAFPFLPTSLTDKTKLGANSANTFAGKGGTESANTFTGSITATVAQVLPNGHLVVVGEKQIGVNQNVDVLRFSGTVDPRAIQPGSIVSSTQVANARIDSRGRGAMDDAQTTGWLSRFFFTLSPF